MIEGQKDEKGVPDPEYRETAPGAGPTLEAKDWQLAGAGSPTPPPPQSASLTSLPQQSPEVSLPEPDTQAQLPLPPWSASPDLMLHDEAEFSIHAQSSSRPRRRLRMVVASVVAVSVLAVFGLMAAIYQRESGVRTAFASVFAKPTLKVVFTAHSSDPSLEADAARYAVALSVTSENGHAPLSGSDAVDDYELSVLHNGTDVIDVIIADHAIFVRLNLQAIDPSALKRVMNSIRSDVPPGPARGFVDTLFSDGWVGVADSTLKSFTRSEGVKPPNPPPSTFNFDNVRNAFTLSFAQAWDVWVSTHVVSSKNGVTEYALNLPVEHFVSTFVSDISQPLLRALPKADMQVVRSLLDSASSAVNKIPANLAIPMDMWVTNGSLTRLDITYKGDSLELAISHPIVGVSSPEGAQMLTTSIIKSLLDDFLGCSSFADSSPLGAGAQACTGASPGFSVGSGSSGVSGISGTEGISGVVGGSSAAKEGANT